MERTGSLRTQRSDEPPHRWWVAKIACRLPVALAKVRCLLRTHRRGQQLFVPRVLMARASVATLGCWLAGAASVASGAAASDWPTSPPEDQAVSSSAVAAMIDHVRTRPRFAHARALLVVRHGTLVSETYFGGSGEESLHDLRSVTKSVLSLLIGIAIERGEISGVEARIRDLLPAYAHLLAGRPQWDLTLEDVLTMQAGLRWNDSTGPWLDAVFFAQDLVEYVLAQPTDVPPGEEFLYSTGLSQVLAKALIGATGQQPHDYARRHLFGPLGIDASAWLVRPSGDDFGGLGMALRPRDQCKLGQLALQRGFWQGQQVVSTQWIDDSTRNQNDEPNPLNGYGYRWWVPQEHRFLAIGYGGQYVAVDRQRDTIICLTVNYNVPNNSHLAMWEFDQLRHLLEDGLVPEAASALHWVDAAGEPLSEPVEVYEGMEDRQLVLRLARRTGDGSSAGPIGSASAKVLTRAGTARTGSDFARLLAEVRWPAGDQEPRELALTIRADGRQESTEDFTVRVEVTTGSSTAPSEDLEVLLHDISAQPASNLSWGGAGSDGLLVLSEAQRSRLEVWRDGDLAQALSVDLDLRAASATAADLVGVLPQQLEFAPGEGVASLGITARADGEVEPTELFTLALAARPGLQVPEPLPVAVRDEASLGLGSCTPHRPWCLQGGRFAVEVEWRNQTSGAIGRGELQSLAAPGAADTSASVTFFSPENLEMLVKVIDGRAINSHFWTYFGKITDLETHVIVTDLALGKVRVWSAAAGQLCGAAEVEAFPAQPGAASAPLGASSPANLAAESPAHGKHRDREPGEECPNDALCFHDRFEVRAQWWAAGNTGVGQPLGLTNETGTFWFFDPSNIEVAVKVLDGRPINGKYWVFSGSSTDVRFDLTVLDRATGAEKVYSRPGGDLCGSADITAFDGTPSPAFGWRRP